MIHLPAGTRVDFVATYLNSAENPNNPNDPPQLVSWGQKTTDEMCIAFLRWLRAAEYEPRSNDRALESLRKGAALETGSVESDE